MKRCFILLFILFAIQVDFLGQSNALILTDEQNSNWFAVFESQDLSRQLELVRNRIISDTAVYNANQFRRDLVNLENMQAEERLNKLGNISQGRVMYFVGYKGAKSSEKYLHFTWDNWTPTSEIMKFLAFLSPEKIRSITILSNQKGAQAIYGSRASFGVVIFNLNKKKYFKRYSKEIKN